jgi:hypothetical protein
MSRSSLNWLSRINTNAIGQKASRQSTVLYALGICVLAASAFFLYVSASSGGDYRKLGASVPSVAPITPSSLPIGQATQPAVIVAGLGVTLTRQGFQPAKINRSPGRFVLAVVNKTGLGSLSLRLDSPVGLALRAKLLPKEEPRWSDVYDLGPGRYTLRESNHPSWVCEITVN